MLCCATALPVQGSPTAGGAASGRVQILVESVDLAAGRVLYRYPPDSEVVSAVAVGSEASRKVSELKPGKRVFVRIEDRESGPAIVEIQGSRRRHRILVATAVVVGVLLIVGFFVGEGRVEAVAR